MGFDVELFLMNMMWLLAVTWEPWTSACTTQDCVQLERECVDEEIIYKHCSNFVLLQNILMTTNI